MLRDLEERERGFEEARGKYRARVRAS
jgi:hypothetical protein